MGVFIFSLGAMLCLVIVLIGIIWVQILDAVQYVNIKWQVASNQITASQSESPITPEIQMRWSLMITLTLITQTKLISGIMRRNKDQPFANQTQWMRSSPSGEKWAPHNAPDRKLKYYTLCSAQGLSHHNYLRTRNFCHSIPIRIIRSRPPSETLENKQLIKHARLYDRKRIFY